MAKDSLKSWSQSKLELFAVKLLTLITHSSNNFVHSFVIFPSHRHFMPEEIFDIVNERDEVVGQNTRREVHARGLWHRAVHVLVFNARGEVFLQKRSLKKDIAAGKWDSSASGHLDTGETYDACAVREVREELGLKIKSPL